MSCTILCNLQEEDSAEYKKENAKIFKEVCSAENKHNGAYFIFYF